MANIEISTLTRNNDGNTYIIKDANAIPKTGSNQISGDLIPATDNTYNLGSSSYGFRNVHTDTLYGYKIFKTVNDSILFINGGTAWGEGGGILLFGKEASYDAGCFVAEATDGTNYKQLKCYFNGTLTWNGQSIQTTSDQRFKQQISEIDDDLLTAWEDVELSQFKYNDAVEEKSDNARLHTGYVVQQIDEACKSHGVDVSKYGLYCHEVYQEETEEVEVEQKDGTKTKERKVIREANEHYSLRYTEALIVECAYLRKCIKELRAEIEELRNCP